MLLSEEGSFIPTKAEEPPAYLMGNGTLQT